MAEKGYVNTENNQIASISVISAPHITQSKQLNTLPNSSSIQSGGDLLPSACFACPGEIEVFRDHPNTYGHLTSLRNKPQQ